MQTTNLPEKRKKKKKIDEKTKKMQGGGHIKKPKRHYIFVWAPTLLGLPFK